MSRATLREAMKLLEQDGLIHTGHGSGRYAAAALRVERPITTYESIRQMLSRQGSRAQVLEIRRELPSAEMPKVLALSSGMEVIRIARLYRHDDKPLVFCIDSVPASLLPGLPTAEDLVASLNDLLDRHGCRPLMSTANVAVTMLPRGSRPTLPAARSASRSSAPARSTT